MASKENMQAIFPGETGPVDLAEVPFYFIEKITSQIPSKDLCLKVSEVSTRFKEAAYDVIVGEFIAVEERITASLKKIKNEISKSFVTRETFQDNLVLITIYGFLQVLEAEYLLMKAILSQRKSLIKSPISFKVIKVIDELHIILDSFLFYQWSGNTDTNQLLSDLTDMDGDFGCLFFTRIWNPRENPFGLLFINLIGCAICSSFDFIVSHSSPPKFKDSMCCITGKFEIPDLSHGSPPFYSKATDENEFVRQLMVYVWRYIRWANAFHVAMLRWNSIDRAIAEGMNYNNLQGDWAIVDPEDPYYNDRLSIRTKTEKEVGGSNRIWKAVNKSGEQFKRGAFWVGVRGDFKLRCPLTEVPEEFFTPEERYTLAILPYKPPSKRNLRFTLNLSSKVKVLSRKSKGKNIVDTCVSLEETPAGIVYNLSKNILF